MTLTFPQVTVDDIEAHERAYRGSEDEERDLKELYTRFGGDMDRHVPVLQCLEIRLTHVTWRSVFCWLCCSRVDLDSHRFMATLQRAVATGA